MNATMMQKGTPDSTRDSTRDSEREAAPRRLAEAATSFQAALAELREAEAALERQLGDLRAYIDAAPASGAPLMRSAA